jgi:site-specific recombinase XerD
VSTNPLNGVRRPKVKNHQGKTAALGNAQARQLLKLPAGEGLQQLRDRALLSVLFQLGLRREEVSSLAVASIHQHRGVPHLRVSGKGGLVGRDHRGIPTDHRQLIPVVTDRNGLPGLIALETRRTRAHRAL